MEPSPLKLKRTPKKRRLSTEKTKCIICEVETGENTRKASTKGISAFLSAMQYRKDAHDIEIAKYFETIVEYGPKQEIILRDTEGDIYWHKQCYCTFTSRDHITRLEDKDIQSEPLPGPSSSKIQRRSFNWKELCMFCDKKSYKKDKCLINVVSDEFCDTLEERAKEKKDTNMDCKVGPIYRKLIVYEAKYHKACHSKYIKVKSKMQSGDKDESLYDTTLETLMTTIEPQLKAGRAYLMTDLLKKFQTLLEQSTSAEKSQTYTSQNLKRKIESKYMDMVQIVTSDLRGKPDIVMDKELKLEDVVNSTAKLRDTLKTTQIEADLTSSSETDFTPERILYYAALILRSVRKDCAGIEIQPLDPADISIEREEQITPEKLYSFVAWVFLSEASMTSEVIKMEDMKVKNPAMHQKILAICQDIIYTGSRGKCRTPKHVGLGIAIHQLTQSRDAIELLNKNGHGISYDEVERIDTCWATVQQTDDGIIVPSNMKPGIPLRAAGDNFNRATESLDGKHLDIVNMVLYQADRTNIIPEGDFGANVDQLRVNRNKTLKDLKLSEILECPNMQGKQPGPRHLLQKVNLQWFLSCSDLHREKRAIDVAYIELRMMPTKLFEMQIERLDNQIPGWTVYHAYLSHKIRVPKTKIGYCPMIPASATEFNTVYTMMKVFQRLFRALGQEWTYVTYDEAIYSKAQMIKWRNMDEFKDDEMDMGGMHRAMNFMGDIGKVMEESGFEDVIVESELYGPSQVQVIMKGKSYNRGVRTHKIMNEALQRLKWKSFQNWLEQNEIQISEEEKESIADDVTSVRGLLQSKRDINDNDEVKSAINSFIEHSVNINHLLHDFTVEGCNLSYTFKFWDTYVNDLSQLLLDYIAAKRDGIRDLELETFAEMLPYDFVCGHTNYARWGSLNVTEGHLLKQNKPELHESISTEQSAVYRTEKPFSGVWHDMALEQSLNKECGKFKQLYTNEGALQKYYLTAHRKAEVTKNMKMISGFLGTYRDEFKEATAERIKKDESAIEKVISVVEERMVNPFEVDIGATEDEKQPLINIATSGVASPEIQNDISKAREMGEKRLQEFVEERLQNDRTDFMAPIPKQTIKTFSTMNKPLKVKTQGKIESVNIDRQIFSKLTIIAQSREVDIKSLLHYELTPVPLSLFNLDGTMRKTTKSVTMSWIEGQHAVKQLSHDEHPTLLVIDLMMLLRMICTDKSDCKTFGDISANVLSVIFGMNYRYTALVGDNYQSTESIKSAERARRGLVQMQEIRNPKKETPIPKQKLKYLSNPANKLNLADFVFRELVTELQEQLPDNMTVFLGGGFKDPKTAVKVEKNECTRVEALESDHEEADSRMFVHIDHAVKELDVKSVVLWSIDSDVAAICPRIVYLLGIKLFFKTGVKDKKRIIPMHDVASDLGESMSLALPVIHALSGCDSTSSFHGQGKKRWLTAMENYPLVLEGIKDIGQHPVNIEERVVESVNQAVSVIYSGKLMANTDDARYDLFSKKGLSSEKLPPTSDALYMHIRRANYQAYIWKSTTVPILDLPSPLDAGWTSDKEGHLVPMKMTQASAPEALLDFTKCSCKTECHTRRCGCLKEDILCTDVCLCDNEICLNRIEYSVSSDSEDDE